MQASRQMDEAVASIDGWRRPLIDSLDWTDMFGQERVLPKFSTDMAAALELTLLMRRSGRLVITGWGDSWHVYLKTDGLHRQEFSTTSRTLPEAICEVFLLWRNK